MTNNLFDLIKNLQEKITQLELTGEYGWSDYFEDIYTYIINHYESCKNYEGDLIKYVVSILRRQKKAKYEALIKHGMNAEAAKAILKYGTQIIDEE